MKLLKKITSLFLASLLCVTLFSASFTLNTSAENCGVFTSADFLKTSGKQIRNNSGSGEVIYLRGTNAGGWLVTESWMNPVNTSCQQVLLDALESRFGKTVRDELIAVYQDNYWTEADFDNCAALGMNVLRLPFWYRDLLDDNNNLKSNAFARLDWFVENAAERGLYVILDMHGAPGSQNGSDHSGVDGGSDKIGASQFFFGNNASYNQNLYYSLWETIASHYKGNPAVAGYDLLNEPYCTYRYNSGYSDSYLHNLLWGIYDNAYDRIRAVDPDHIIIMEATWNPVDLPNPTQYGWSNVMYEYHNYLYDDYDNANGGQISNMQSKINSINSANYNVPSYMGEFCYFNSANAWDQGLALLNNAGLNWTSWSYKVLSSYGNWGVYNHNPSKVDPWNDSEATIRQKWSTVGANNAWLNTNTSNIFKTYLPGAAAGSNPFTGDNLALNKSVTASGTENSSSENLAASNAVDGNTSTRWSSNFADNAYITVDLGGNYALSGVRLNWEAAYAEGYRIDVSSDGTNFTTVHTENSGNGGIDNITLNNVPARYVRMQGTSRTTIGGSQYGYSLYEFEVYGGTPIAVPATFNSTEYIDKSSEISNNTTYVGNLVNGSYLDYLIDVPTTGNYTISVMAAAGNSNSNRVISAYNGKTLLTTLPVLNSTDWFAYSQLKNGLTLNKGVQTLRLSTNGSVNIENITISYAPDTYQIPCSVNASEFMRSEGVITVNGNNVENFEFDDKTFYIVNVPETGEYKITLNTSATADNAKVHIDTDLSGSFVWVNSIDLPNTGSLSTYQNTEAVINLTAGVQTLKFVVQNPFNFKGFTIERVARPEPDPEPETVDAYVFKIGDNNAYWTTYDYAFTVDVPCQFVDSATYVPFRVIAQAAGAKSVSYNASEGKVTIVNNANMTFELTMFSTACTYTVDGVTYDGTINSAPQFIDGQCCLPIRDVANVTFASVQFVQQGVDGYVLVSANELTADQASQAIDAYINAMA